MQPSKWFCSQYPLINYPIWDSENRQFFLLRGLEHEMPCGQFHEQIGLNEKDQGTCSLHVFTNLEFSYCFFEKKLSFFVGNNILNILAFYNLC